MITGEKNINLFRLHALKGALSLEIKGMKHSRGSVYQAVKNEFGFKGNREKVLAQLEKHIAILEAGDEGKRLIKQIGGHMEDGVREGYTNCTPDDIAKEDYGMVNWLGERGYVDIVEENINDEIVMLISLTSKGADVYEAMEGEA